MATESIVPDSIPISNGKTTLYVAPQNLRIYFSEEATKVREDLEAGRVKGDESVRVAERSILACVRRNHPTCTLEELREVLDTADIWKLHAWVMTKSGLKPGPLAEGAGASSPSAAPTSSGTSSTPPAGSQTTSSTG